jgi:polyhydroxyalkanoate synthesis regulator phasin
MRIREDGTFSHCSATIEECAELFDANKTRSALLAMEHAREDAANKAQLLEWIDERCREGDLSAQQATELVELLSTRQIPHEREEQTASAVFETDYHLTNSTDSGTTARLSQGM